MGTRIGFLRCYLHGLGTPSFPTHPSMRATVINHARDRDRRAARSATGRGNDPSIPESLWGRARGCFGGPVGLRMERANAAGRSQLGEFSKQEPRRPRISTSQISGGDSRHVEKGDFSSIGMQSRAFVESPSAAARSGHRSGRDRRTPLKRQKPRSGETGVSQEDDRVRGKPVGPSYLANGTGIDAVPLRHLAVPWALR